jgi:rare lipoprotein A (peptidoglycan hydrolase)
LEHALGVLHYPFVYLVVVRQTMRVTAIAIVSALTSMHISSAAAQNFEERWSIIPKAHAEPAPKNDDQNKSDPQIRPPSEAQETNRPADRSVQTFSGKASFYSYRRGKTASGTSFDRNLPSAAHRSLPFGTKVRVTNLANERSVIVIINDRGPAVRGRVLDLSLDAARILGITDRGVADNRGEVL